jgi:hypothetical protein
MHIRPSRHARRPVASRCHAVDMRIGKTLMATHALGCEDARTMQQTDVASKPARRRPARIRELEAQIDERDEIIRLLNEALSKALDELNKPDLAA